MIAATVALMYGASAQAGGPLLPRVQAGLKQLPLAAPVAASNRGLNALAQPTLGKALTASLPGLAATHGAVSAKFYYPRPDPGHGADWLTYNTNTWFKQDFDPYFWNVVQVGLDLSADLGAQVAAAGNIVGPCDASACVDVWTGNTQEYVAEIIDFGLSRGAGVAPKIGPAPLPKRPEELAGLTPTLVGLNVAIFGS
ncbi:MAG TPA: hypothetical protein VGE51_14720, partial [Fontimonas sp.]